MNLPTLNSLETAAAIVHGFMPPTPQIRWPLLCARTGTDVWVKHENHTPTGAFKLRNGSGVMVNNVHVIKTDIVASNGVIHVMDGVILPK